MEAESLMGNYLSGVAATFTVSLVNAAGTKVKKAVLGTPKERSLRRAVEAGIIAMLADARTRSRDEKNLLDSIFREFFSTPEVAEEMSPLLWGRELDPDKLSSLFEKAGFVPDELPGLDFDHAIVVFQAAFLEEASEDPNLQQILQTRALLRQLSAQEVLLEEVRTLLEFLREIDPKTVAVMVGKIIAETLQGERKRLDWIPVGVTPVNWEAHYLEALINKCDPLDLSPIDESLNSYSRPVKISEVFTTLNLDGVTRRSDETVSQALSKFVKPPMEDKERGTTSEREREVEHVPIQAVEAVAEMQRLVILGEPGSGKSTLTNYIATQLARRKLGVKVSSDALPGWPEDESPLPVRIVLRRFAAWLESEDRRGNAGDVWNYLEHMLGEWGCSEAFAHVKGTLWERGGIVFFDGLDEVQETDEAAKRTMIIESIEDFARLLDKVKVVVTCRNYAYERKEDPWHLPEDVFPVFRLAKFGKKQIEHFVHVWYRAVRGIKGWNDKKASEEADDLFRRIIAWKHIFELAQNPLLLTLMAQVHGAGHLPENRADLYDSAVDLLLARWENRLVRDERGRSAWEPGVIARLGIKKNELRQRLEKVAFHAHERQETERERSERTADISREDLREELRDMLGSLDRAEAVLKYIQERAGLLIARDNRTYAFPHRSFQEYLAAMWIMRMDNFDEALAERIRRDLTWWREVFLLAAGANRNTPRVVSDLVDALLPFPPGEGKGKWAFTSEGASQATLAAQALNETDFEPASGRYEATYDRVRDWLLASLTADEVLTSRQRSTAGDALAKLGDPRFDADHWYLPKEPLMGFVPIPAGKFLMGSSPKKDRYAGKEEQPQHTVNLDYDYWIARYPVTVAQWRTFVEATVYDDFSERALSDPDNHPVRGITWYSALDYARWLNERLHEISGEMLKRAKTKVEQDFWRNLSERRCRVTLPSEAEWEKAARGGLEIPKRPFGFGDGELAELMENPNPGRIYPWGDERDPNLANYHDTEIGDTSAVGCFPGGVSPYGVEEMSGNVWEWTRSLWGSYPYPSDEEGIRKREDLKSKAIRVVRGGSFVDGVGGVCVAYRNGNYPHYRDGYSGFRVVCLPSQHL